MCVAVADDPSSPLWSHNCPRLPILSLFVIPQLNLGRIQDMPHSLLPLPSEATPLPANPNHLKSQLVFAIQPHNVSKLGKDIRDHRLCKVKRHVTLVHVRLPKGLDLVHAVAVTKRHGKVIGADQAGVAADIGEIGARMQAGEVLKVDLDFEAIG